MLGSLFSVSELLVPVRNKIINELFKILYGESQTRQIRFQLQFTPWTFFIFAYTKHPDIKEQFLRTKLVGSEKIFAKMS